MASKEVRCTMLNEKREEGVEILGLFMSALLCPENDGRSTIHEMRNSTCAIHR
jgi:hypothetical protein